MRDDSLLAGDQRKILGGDRRLLRVARGFADAHVQHDLVETRNLHLVLVLELFEKRLADRLLVDLLQARLVLGRRLGLCCCLSH
jgi:hypothetical protein